VGLDEGSEDIHGDCGQVRGRIIGTGQAIHAGLEYLVGPIGQRVDEALLRPEEAVHRPGCRLGFVRDGPDRDALEASCRKDPLGRVGERLSS
jgi:hypothetical protein